jgi:hypothetical protein
LVPLVIRYRVEGSKGLLFPIQLAPAWVSDLMNGNAQGLIIGMTALAPWWVRAGAVLVAVATWVKLYPICVVVWWLGRREWTALRWFGLAFVALALVQLPWLHEFIAFSRGQLGLAWRSPFRSLGAAPWLVVIAILTFLTYTRARDERGTGKDRGWLYCVLLQIAVLPRLQAVNLPLLLMHPTLLASPYSALTDTLRHPLKAVGIFGGVIVLAFIVLVLVQHAA